MVEMIRVTDELKNHIDVSVRSCSSCGQFDDFFQSMPSTRSLSVNAFVTHCPDYSNDGRVDRGTERVPAIMVIRQLRAVLSTSRCRRMDY